MQLEQCLVLLCIKLIDNQKVALVRCILQFSELLLSLEERYAYCEGEDLSSELQVIMLKNNLQAPRSIRFTEPVGPNQIS